MKLKIGLSSLLVAFLGIVFVSISLPMSVYTDESAYNEAMAAIDAEQSLALSAGDRQKMNEVSNKFFATREKYVTSKYRLHDLGWALIILGGLMYATVGFYVFVKKDPLKPLSKRSMHVLSQIAYLLLMIGFIYMFFLDFERGEFPWWADSISIPIFGIGTFYIFTAPIFFIIVSCFLKGYDPKTKLDLKRAWPNTKKIIPAIPLLVVCVLIGFSIFSSRPDYSGVPADFLGLIFSSYYLLGWRTKSTGHQKLNHGATQNSKL